MNTATKLAVAAAFALLAVGGCATDGHTHNDNCCLNKGLGDDFIPSDETRVADTVGRQMAASAARADCTLRAHHFHGGELNSLGERKLDLILRDDDQSLPITLYFDMPEDDPSAVARREAASRFLVTRGVPEEQIKLASGSNPGNGVPTAPLLKNMVRTESLPGEGGSGMGTE